MTRQEWKQILISILVGATVAFLSSLIDGVRELLNGYGNDIAGGTIGALRYLLPPRS